MYENSNHAYDLSVGHPQLLVIWWASLLLDCLRHPLYESLVLTNLYKQIFVLGCQEFSLFNSFVFFSLNCFKLSLELLHLLKQCSWFKEFIFCLKLYFELLGL